jgi:tubulin monoglycylase TTLL3/8
MKDLALDCFLSAKNSMNPSKRRNSFEFFGFDFMIDEDFRIWLIEVNTNPCFELSSSLLARLIPNMIENAF